MATRRFPSNVSGRWGGGVGRRRGAGAEVLDVAEALGAGVARALLGKDELPVDLPFASGSVSTLVDRPYAGDVEPLGPRGSGCRGWRSSSPRRALIVDHLEILDVVTDPNTANRPPDPKTSVLEKRDRTLSRDAGP